MAFRELRGKSRVGNNLPGTHGARPYIIRTRNKVIERRRKRNEVQRVLQRRPASGVVLGLVHRLPRMLWEVQGRQQISATRVTTGAPWRRPILHPLREASALTSKRRPKDFDCAITFSEPQRGAVTGHVRLTAGATQGEGSLLGRDPSKTGRSSPERPETFAVQLRPVPRCVHTDGHTELPVQTAFPAADETSLRLI